MPRPESRSADIFFSVRSFIAEQSEFQQKVFTEFRRLNEAQQELLEQLNEAQLDDLIDSKMQGVQAPSPNALIDSKMQGLQYPSPGIALENCTELFSENGVVSQTKPKPTPTVGGLCDPSKLSEVTSSMNSEQLINILSTSDKFEEQRLKRTQTSTTGRVQLLWQDIRRMDKDAFELAFDTIIGVVIFINAVFLGFDMQYNSEQYPEWLHHPLFVCINVVMCTIFVSELLIKVSFHGAYEHFRGSNSGLNCMDAGIVLADVVSLFGDIAASVESPIPPSLFRLVRLVRLCRLLRLIRSSVFADLLAMIYGILGGMVTLGWALILLMVFLYFFSLMFFVLVGGSDIQEVSEYFSDVPRSFLTTYRCSFGDCTTVGGQPMFEHVYLASHPLRLLVIMFGLFGFFFWVGLFNVISAIFVESTLSAAARLETTRRAERLASYDLWAHNISLLIRILLEHAGHPCDSASMLERSDEIMQLEITCELLKKALLTTEARQALLNLDIAWEDHETLSDALDPDNGGTIIILDLMLGLGRLRGNPRRSDIVTVDLMIRVVQREIHAVHKDVRKMLSCFSLSVPA